MYDSYVVGVSVGISVAIVAGILIAAAVVLTIIIIKRRRKRYCSLGSA